MAGESILTPGYEEVNEGFQEAPSTEEQYLLKDNYLKEYKNPTYASIVRSNLGVPSTDMVNNITENLDGKISEGAAEKVNEHLAKEDPHGTKAWAQQEFPKYIKKDGSTKFTAPQSGVDPTKGEHLTTKKFVESLLETYKQENNPSKILPQVEKMLEDYLKISNMYSKTQLYTRDEINEKISKFVKTDGTTAFTKAQYGVYPTSDAHLSTKKYVDDKVREHIISVDPHGFITILNQRLAKYAKSEDVLDKTETYSRTQIDNEISRIVAEAIDQSLADYKDSVNNKFEHIRREEYVKRDGSVSFKNPQSSVEATEDSHLVTLGQVNKLISEIQQEVSDKIEKDTCVWVTSGPVETTVGFLEDNSRVPQRMSIQEVLDSIFYGKKVSVTAPETGKVGEKVDVVVCITGDLNTVDLAQLYQNDELIRTIQREEFEENGCITIQSDIIDGDTEFRLDVYYSNDAKHSEYAETKLAYPIFVGIYNEWYFGSYMVYDDLVKWTEKDPVNNVFYNREDHLRELEHQFNFNEDKPVRIILAMPASYPELQSMNNDTQKVGARAFKVMNSPFTLPGNDGKATDYRIYLYKQELVRLDSKVTFKF